MWPERIIALVRTESWVARAVIVGASGSTPRPVASSLIVTPETVEGTIGGGALETAVVEDARAAITTRPDRFWTRTTRDYPLGPILGQPNGTCRVLVELFGTHEAHVLEKQAGPVALRPLASGAPVEWTGSEANLSMDARHVAATAVLAGRVDGALALDPEGGTWWVERAAPLFPKLFIFAGGPVTAALRRITPGLPFDVIWIDANEAAEMAASAAPGAYHVVMSGSHALDLQICRTLLARGEPAYLGLMGSPKKRARLVTRLIESGLDEAAMRPLRCPIGLPAVPGKEPSVIAVAIAAELVGVLRGVVR